MKTPPPTLEPTNQLSIHDQLNSLNKWFLNGNFMNGKPESLAMEINTMIIKITQSLLRAEGSTQNQSKTCSPIG